MILDSTFLVDFEREARRGAGGAAFRFLEEHPDVPLCVTFTIAGELAAGETLGNDRAGWQEFLAPFRLLEWKPDISWRCGRVYRELAAKGALIGANDLWIAATALCYGMPLVTRNRAEFARVNGLEVFGY